VIKQIECYLKNQRLVLSTTFPAPPALSANDKKA
jgi:hypothetical protein